MKLADTIDILRYVQSEYIALRDLMVHEIALELDIAGVAHKTLYCSPDELGELVLGHLYTQGYIRSAADIEAMEVDVEARRATVRLCGAGAHGAAQTPPLSGGPVFDPAVLLRNQAQFYEESTLQKATAGMHRSALCDDAGTHMACIDVSRHNTIDKLVGKAAGSGCALVDKYIITSGRVPSDMIRKIIAIGVPMLVSRSTPTIAAVEAAKAANVTLLGFSRENRFNIYSAPFRLKGCPPGSLMPPKDGEP